MYRSYRAGPSPVFLLAVMGIVGIHIARDISDIHARNVADGKISVIMNAAAINDKAEQKVVYKAAHDNKFDALPPAEVKPAHDVREVMLDKRWLFHPKS